MTGWLRLVVILTIGGLSPLAAAKNTNTPPNTYTFNDNETVPVVLSSVDINRLVVKDDKIMSIDCPAGFCVGKSTRTDPTGAARLKLNIAVPFVAYVTTQKGRQFGMLISSRARPAVTSEFIGLQSTLAEPPSLTGRRPTPPSWPSLPPR